MRTPAEILAETKTIALVGASPRPERPSNSVMRYLLAQGYRVILCARTARRSSGSPAWTPCDIEEPVDLVDVFRRAEFCPDVAEQAAAQQARRRSGSSSASSRGGAGDRRARRDGLRRERVHRGRAQPL